MKKQLTFLYILYFVLFVFLLFLNVDRIPLVWFDEVMGLDPAVNLIFKDGFHSKIWPQTGADQHFMAYLPMRFVFHSIHLLVLPFEVAWMRVPWLIYFLIAAFVLLKSAKHYSAHWLIAFFVCFLFINDKTVFEVARSMRLDSISMLFIALCLYNYIKERYVLQALFATVLIFIHPNLWVVALFMFFDASFKVNREKSIQQFMPNALWLMPILSFALFFISISFDFNALYVQLFEHGSEHTAEGGLSSRLYNHFIARFWPYYNTQPYMPLLIYAALFRSAYRIIRKECSSLDLIVVLTHLYWILLLAPFYRYNAVLVLISIFSLLPLLTQLKLNRTSYAVILLFLMIHPLNVLARHSVALLQREERNPQPLVDWLQTEIGDKKAIIMGHDLAYYAVAKSRSVDYMMFNLNHDKFDLNDYNAFYILTNEQLPIKTTSAPKVYSTSIVNLHHKLDYRLRRIPTYRSMYLYEVRDSNQYLQIKEYLDDANYSVNRD